MNTSWHNSGLLFDSLGKQEIARGGKWMIGDRFVENHPGHSKTFCYKSWIADGKKYKPGAYEPKDRTDCLKSEYVTGIVEALLYLELDPDTKKEIYREEVSESSSILIPPDTLRVWELPEEGRGACGSTILWSGASMHIPNSFMFVPRNFCFGAWHNDTISHFLHRPSFTAGFELLFVEVFQGELHCAYEEKETILRAGEYLYVNLGKNSKLVFSPQSRGVCGTVLYY